MIWYHGTSKECWRKIQAEGVLFGVRGFGADRCTYLATNIQEAQCYGEIVLQVDYDPFINSKDNNYVEGCWQMRVYEPIPLNKIKVVNEDLDMTQEDKQLLLKDLCMRIPHRTFVCLNPGAYNKPEKCLLTGVHGEKVHLNVDSDPFRIDHIKPYLRPMSSMTEEEKYIYRHMLGATLNSEGESIMFVYVEDFPIVIDWLNAHHFDYRGLIEKELALEAPEGMYKV